MNVADLMTRNVITAGLGTSVRHAADLMLAHRVSGLPVVDDDGQLVGLVTEGDLLRRAELGFADIVHPWQSAVSQAGLARDFVKRHSWRVADVMASPVTTIAETASISEAAQVMDTRGIKRLPVVRERMLVGIISRADLLHCIADERPDPIARGDEAIRISVAARLTEAAATLGGVLPKVTVRDGIVHLWGALASLACRDVARVIVETVPGTRGFEDHTRISPAAEGQSEGTSVLTPRA